MDDFYSPTLTIWLGKWGDVMYEYEQSILWMRGCACICVCSCSVSEHRLHRFFSWQRATVTWAAISALTQPRHEEVEKNKLQAICKPVRRTAGPCEAIYPLLEPQPGLAHAANAALHTGASWWVRSAVALVAFSLSHIHFCGIDPRLRGDLAGGIKIDLKRKKEFITDLI